MAFSCQNIKPNFVPPTTHVKKDLKKTEDEQEEEKNLRIERQNIIDAVVVRVMKARKTEKYNQLLEDVIKQISMFLPQQAMIKQRIESLIEREYLKRDDVDKARFIYLP